MDSRPQGAAQKNQKVGAEILLHPTARRQIERHEVWLRLVRATRDAETSQLLNQHHARWRTYLALEIVAEDRGDEPRYPENTTR